ncbi:N-hydroxyarylamine O-acetyltransferase [Natronospira proteinivora]|uniref:N-hydroxyarylamine O-acetyltransferase n=1 Tax=Natronospira proteinivora TaxID=1807133 RepID=A0ABT1G5M2_9GAMM|nr:arylamine N-acetyltransferase [Natronospira proteinivora]MCP1726594.1 N-hydroxyarylamine O-acetyltransferase [Natronospira proteinivora]
MSTQTKTDSSTQEAQWGSPLLDLKAYLARIDYHGSIKPDVETLRALQRAHLDAIPFENLDIISGGDIRLDLASLQEKLVYRRRGGYCHEQNILFATVLDKFGFHVTGRSARMLMGNDESKLEALGHTCLNVRIDGVDWHVDVGVGNTGPRVPIPLEEGVESRQDGWAYRMDRTREGRWLLRYHRHDGWFNLYQFSEEPYYRVDYQEHNYIASKHPESPFVRRIVAQRNGSDIRYALTDCELKIFRPGQPPEYRQIPPADIPELLQKIFSLDLTQENMRTIVRRAQTAFDSTSEGESLGT